MPCLADRWPLPGHAMLRDQLLEAWAGVDRGYHNERHLREVLDRLDELAAHGAAFDRLPVLLAAWFHDAVHDASPDPEGRSAAWARTALAEDEDLAREVARLVELTRAHDPADDDLSGAALCDADLAILAAPTARYTDYVAGVRAEYAAFDDTSFAAGRLAVLEPLAAGPLFRTEHARTRWAPAARANLAREVAQLRAVLGRRP